MAGKAFASIEGAIGNIKRFEEIELDKRALEAMKAGGVSHFKRWMACEGETVASIDLTERDNNRVTVKIVTPCTQVIGDSKAIEKLATPVMMIAQMVAPANVAFVDGRLALTVVENYTSNTDVSKDFEQLLVVSLASTKIFKEQLKKAEDDGISLDTDKDKLWQKEMGRPVKLTPEELALAAGGDLGDIYNAVGEWIGWIPGAYGGGTGGGIGGAIGGSYIPGAGTVGGAVGGALGGGWGGGWVGGQVGSGITDTVYDSSARLGDWVGSWWGDG